MVRAAIDALGGDGPAARSPSALPAGMVELGQADPSAKLPIRRLAAE